ncbi:protein LTV1 homolog [Ischnura elegans]|uniref:protein LTV1 homolog n=1 Tax=Ischnura elegans TaxID=197161 RepID=UPI001ED8ADB7|nr:protein LTV1 homolog [Ischnura elegans]
MPKKKKFIDKKNAITFHLVHRSQKDPLTADERAPKRVLVPLEQKPKEAEKNVLHEEQRKYGIFFDDDYNYLQHLRDANAVSVEWEPCERYRINKQENSSKESGENKPRVTLPSSVFASNVEEEVGLLNKAAPHSGPRLDYDPDIVAAMDEDFDYEDPNNELEDDFIAMANASPERDSDDEESVEGFENASWDEERDEVGSLDGPFAFADEETKSRFTEYSMSSSVMRRNEQLTLLDSRFEKMFESYDDTEIGALETEEIEGDMPLDNGILMQCADEFEKERRAKVALEEARLAAHGDDDELPEEDENEDEETIEVDASSKDDRKWDCESILSTYSNIYNHPKLIKDNFSSKNTIKISAKTGVPLGVLRSDRNSGLTPKGLAALDRAYAMEKRNGEDETVSVATSAISQLSFRPKEETPEERRLRKQALKNYRKERRMERKANTLAFKEEKKKQEKILLNNKQNIYNVKIM